MNLYREKKKKTTTITFLELPSWRHWGDYYSDMIQR